MYAGAWPVAMLWLQTLRLPSCWLINGVPSSFCVEWCRAWEININRNSSVSCDFRRCCFSRSQSGPRQSLHQSGCFNSKPR